MTTREEAIAKALDAARNADAAMESVWMLNERVLPGRAELLALQARTSKEAALAWVAVASVLPLDQEAETEAPQHEVETEYEIECPACDGSGHADPDDAFGTCEACNGTGWEGG